MSVDEKYFRPTEVDLLVGDSSKANSKLGWKPKYNLKNLVDEMMDSDLKLMSKDKHLNEKKDLIYRLNRPIIISFICFLSNNESS